MKGQANIIYFVLGIIVLLIGLALIIPSNTLTGHIIKEGTCKELGCVELCDYGVERNYGVEQAAAEQTSGSEQAGKSGQVDDLAAPSTCKDEGTTCCFTHWDTGVCDYDVNCEKIREYSLYQTLSQYEENVKEKPAPVDISFGRFFLPLMLVIGIMVYFTIMRNDKTRELK